MAIACFRLLTLRPDPLFSVPFFLRRIVDATLLDADRPYFAIDHLNTEIENVHGLFQELRVGSLGVGSGSWELGSWERELGAWELGVEIWELESIN